MTKQKNQKLTEKVLKELEFTCERVRDRENDKDGIWYKGGITLHQDFWEGKDFNFATRLDDEGEFKSGYRIKDTKQLRALEKALNGK